MHSAANLVVAIDHRLALVLMMALLLAAAAPIVVAWLALLPAEPEPFARAGDPKPVNEHSDQDRPRRDPFALFLLVNTTFSVLLRFPGVDSWLRMSQPGHWIAGDTVDTVVMIAWIWFGFIPALSAAYSAVRPNPIRVPLLAGGIATLALWLARPWLLTQISGNT